VNQLYVFKSRRNCIRTLAKLLVISRAVLELICRGLKWISKHRAARLNAIAERIAQSTYDIVALQEIWVYADFENLAKKTAHILPYAKFYFSGVLGGGLAILSKWPIESTTMWRYPLNGRPTAFWRGDWYVGKGVASALIRHTSGQLIEVFNTHVQSTLV
jgi:sphingomyelin phosphodiesterase 2